MSYQHLLVLVTTFAIVLPDCFDHGFDYMGNDVNEGHYTPVASPEACQRDCQADSACWFWTWDKNYHGACWHKTAKTEVVPSEGLISGPKYCGGQTTSGPGDDSHLRVLSYNMYGWNALIQNPWKAENMYKAIRASNPDLMGAQEVEDRAGQVASAIGSDYRVAGTSSAGHSIIYRDSVLQFEGWGVENLAEQDQWGQRTVEWAKFTHKISGRQVDHFNTHLCVCDANKLLLSVKTIASKIASIGRPGSLKLLTGDFNVFDGYEHSKAIQYLTGQLESSPVIMKDTFRQVNDDSVDGTTFPGAGKLDYILTGVENEVSNAWIDRTWYGEASDHLPISAVVNL